MAARAGRAARTVEDEKRMVAIYFYELVIVDSDMAQVNQQMSTSRRRLERNGREEEEEGREDKTGR